MKKLISRLKFSKIIELIINHTSKHLFLRFVLVGILNTIFGYSCFAVFLSLGFHYSFAVFFATVLGVAFNFKSISALVFDSQDNSLIFRFVGSYLVIYVLNVIGIKLFSFIRVSPYIAGGILIFPMSIISFILNKRFVFQNG